MAIMIIALGCGIPAEEAAEKGLALYKENRLEEAYPWLKRAYTGGVEKPELALCLAYCKVSIDNDPSGAIGILRDSVLRFPDYAPAYYQLGLISYNFGPVEDNRNLAQAIHFSRLAVERDPDLWFYNDNLATYYYLNGQLDSALVYFRLASGLNPADEKLEERVREIERKINPVDSMEITAQK